jgi:uncharacterized protein YceH (UPF0502 family)
VSKVEALHPVEVRVLGSLLEKDIVTPEYYPLTLNALVNACNQKSSREPIVSYDEETVQRALEPLHEKGLVTRVGGAGHRVEKFAHRISDKLNLGRRELAILCVLMLRGPQTTGELRGRTERMHSFADLDEVENCLHGMMERELVVAVPRGRWAHLLAGPPSQTEAASAPPPATSRAELEARIDALEREMDALKQEFAGFRRQFE